MPIFLKSLEMSADKMKRCLARNLLNIPGWRTNHKIVVIESDDWGSIRMASKEAYLHFLKKGYPVDKCPYNRYDALESNGDLENLFEVLASVKDIHGNPAVLTANCVTANPDFEKIKANDFQEYFYEPFTETLKQYPCHDRVYHLYKEGIRHKLIKPQFHGREHLNVARWMKDLQAKKKVAHDAFEMKMFSIHKIGCPENRNEYMDALYFETPAEKERLKQSVAEGALIFEKTWGFLSKSFIAPSYIWDDVIETVLNRNGVDYIQGVAVQRIPEKQSPDGYSSKYHFQGQRNSFGQRYLIRNVFFEPTQLPGFDWVSDCMNRIKIAFRWHKPAIISTHRLNYIGCLDPANTTRSLPLFARLLMKIIKNWPDVEFMSSDQLGNLMNGVNGP